MLYKYMPYERVDVLEKLKIRFSPLPSLNDPFEVLPLIDMSSKHEELVAEIEKDLEDLWESTEEQEQTKENRQILEQVKKEQMQNLNTLLSPNSVGEGVISLLGDNFGVLSLSRTETSLLMWSHYASEGKGYVLALDDDHKFFRQHDMEGNLTRPIPVVYSEKRRKIVPGEENYYQKLLCEKPLEWAYEQEERLFRTFLSKEGAVGKDTCDQDIILSYLPRKAIKGVYIGYRAGSDTRSRLFSAIEKNSIDCPVFDASICNEEYRVIFSEAKNT